MRKYILNTFFILVSFQAAIAQKPITGFIYELTYKRDTNNLDKSGKTLMLLMTDGFESTYLSYNRYLKDTILAYQKTINSDYKTTSQIIESRGLRVIFSIQIHKKDKEVVFNENLGFDWFSYSLDPKYKPVWKIHTERKEIGKYPVQKATTTYAGRDYVAWFTEEIPISDGPHVFSGLPGLILKVTDTQGHFDFEWVETKKDKNFRVTPNIPKGSISIPYEKFMKSRQSYHSNPVQYLENNGSNVRAAGLADRIEENFKKKNNLIERKF